MTDIRLKSFIDVSSDSDFSVQNLPYGIFCPKSGGEPRACTAIGGMVLDLSILEDSGLIKVTADKKCFSKKSLNCFMSRGLDIWKKARIEIQKIVSGENPSLKENQRLRKKALIPMKDVQMCMPVEIGDYTDFYSSKEHATNVGIMFRGKENALMPNWLHLPVAYHGRASSVVISGTHVHRPKGQTKADNEDKPKFEPTRMLDFELETGFFVGPGNKLGEPIAVGKALDHIFGMVLVNDWSARDMQKWEYQPLGPFLSKNFGTSISPWVVTMEALEPFRIAGPAQNPKPLPYLQSKENCTYDINLEVKLQTKKLTEPFIISISNFKYLYWNMCQQLAHHTVNGCNLKTGDLLASGTISGQAPDSYGSMLELTWLGEKPIKLPNGEERKFLQDGDTIIISGYCQGNGYRVGFGEVSGKILGTV
ncbi:MAG: fumarylacetoacetase [Ignavibacteria bacterium]